ncbi:MAG TPA: PAS domain-containing sensor histidine kinase [Gammaproteobacteria bacterium]
MSELPENARARLAGQALDAVPEAVFVVDSLRPGRPNVLVNAAYCALTGYDAGEAIATGFDALAIFADAAEVSALDAGHGEAPARTRVRIRHRGGTVILATLELRGVQRAEGRHLVGLLTRETAPEPATDGAAPKPDRDTFLSWLTHELRSPLNACVMWLDVLALSPQPDKLPKAVDAIKRNLARQTRLVRELGDAAKVSTGGLEVRLEPVDVVALVKGELGAWQSLAVAKQIEFHPLIEMEAAPVAGDAARLTEALNQLLESAVGSTPAGGRVDLLVREASGNCVVEVADTGVALSPEDAANLGVPLWRSPTSPRARSGIGLGLAVAHHVAAKHGGALTAASVASGARFMMTLPLARNSGTGAVARTGPTSGF